MIDDTPLPLPASAARSMLAMRAVGAGRPLVASRMAIPAPSRGQVLVKVLACAVCRTDLHVVDGELAQCRYPVVPGHEIVGVVVGHGEDCSGPPAGTRVGIAWLGWTCGACEYCTTGRENLCDAARFTGCHVDGGYAEYALADCRFCFPLPAGYDDIEAAPLLCAGLIGLRSLRLAGDARRLGIYGFGAAAHILAQIARHEQRSVFAFTRPGDDAAQDFARELGAQWAGDSDASPPTALDAAIVFAPVGSLVPRALAAVRKGGIVVCGGIHMSDIPTFPYSLLWGERVVRSVANLTRQDALEFLALAPRAGVRTYAETFPLAEANRALDALRGGRLRGAAVLVPAAVD